MNQPALDALVFRGHHFVPMASGALHWPARDALIVADLHLEKLASYALGSRMLLPPYDTGLTLRRLEKDLESAAASHVIALGDSLHRDRSVETLQAPDRERLARMLRGRRWTWIAGNHDPAPNGLGGVCAKEVEMDGILLCHEPTVGRAGMIAGHMHPGAKVSINGRSNRSRCFINDERLLIMPAYGSSTGAMNVLAEPFARLMDVSNASVRMLGKDGVHRVHPRRLVTG